MQIDRNTSLWLYVFALTILLVMCLTVPIYWQSDGLPAANTADDQQLASLRAACESAKSDWDKRWSDRPTSGVSSSGLDEAVERVLVDLSQHDAPELANTAPRVAGDPKLLNQFFDELAASSPPQPAGSWSDLLTDAYKQAGQKLGELKSTDLVGTAVGKLAAVISHPPTRLADEVTPLPAPEADDASLANVYPTPWSAPVTLIRRLERLAEYPDTQPWADATIEQIRILTDGDQISDEDAAASLSQLATLTAEAATLTDLALDDRLRTELLRARWGLVRRLECWGPMQQITVATAGANRFATLVPGDEPSLVFAGQGTEPLDLQALSANLETYEEGNSPQLARQIVETRLRLANSPDPQANALAGRIEEHYRNANMRVALSAELLNRFVSQPEPEVRSVRDRIAGTPVRGHSTTTADNRVVLIPSNGWWHLKIASDGIVEANTVADGGQARLRSQGSTKFSAHKSIIVDAEGVHLNASAVDAANENQLISVRSSCDWIPIVGEMMREYAVDSYKRKRPQARAEVEHKVARRLRQQLDTRAEDVLKRTEQAVQERLTEPLKQVGIELTPVELTTTKERVVARLRLAGREQLAGHTPRPRAPSDSLASIQLHDSAFTNAAIALGLNGQTYTGQELQTALREKFPRLGEQPAMPIEKGTAFKFADRDAVQFTVADGKLQLSLAMTAVKFEGRVVRNFRVHATYRPVVQGVEAELVRDGALGIEGRIRTADRVRMHGVFNKILSEDRRLPVVRISEAGLSRTDDLMITQFVLEDGWLGVAVGRHSAGRTAELSRALR